MNAKDKDAQSTIILFFIRLNPRGEICLKEVITPLNLLMGGGGVGIFKDIFTLYFDVPDPSNIPKRLE